MLRPVLLSLALIFLTACQSSKVAFAPPPEAINNTVHVIGQSKTFELTNHEIAHLNDTMNIIYLQTYGGMGNKTVMILAGLTGGIGAGLAAGANISAIKNETTADVAILKNRIPINPVEVFNTANAGKIKISTTDNHNGQHTVLAPYVYVVKHIEKDDRERLLFSSALMVETGSEEDGTFWRGKYLIQLDMDVSKDEVANLSSEQMEKLKAQLQSGYQAAIDLYLDDKKGLLFDGKFYKFKSDVYTPKHELTPYGKLVRKTDDRKILRMGDGLFSFPADSVPTWQ